MAQLIFDNMIRALQELSDAHLEETGASYLTHSTWLSGAVADTWLAVHGTAPSEDQQSSCVVGEPSPKRSSGPEREVAVEVSTRPPLPLPAPTVPADAHQPTGAGVAKLGIAAAGRPPVPRRKGTLPHTSPRDGDP